MKKWMFVMFVMWVIPSVAAAETKVGVSPAVVSFTISDPDGSTDSYTGFQGLSAVSIHDLNNKLRIVGSFSYFDFEVDPSTSNIGQKVQAYQLGAQVQHIVRVARSLNFYAGVGVAYNMSDFTARHTVDRDGYLQTRYADRSINFFSLMANISKEWEINDKFDIGADISYQYGIGDGFSGFKGALNLLYKF